MTCHGTIVPPPIDADIIAESEAIERLALRSLHGVATPRLQHDLRLDWHETRGGAVSIAAALPPSAIVVNRAFLAEDADPYAMAASYRARGVARFFLHIPHGRPSEGQTVAAKGLEDARAWQKFVRHRGTALPDTPALRIERIAPGPHADAAARIVCAAFDLSVSAEGWIARLCRDDRWQVFLARIDGVPAGTGALFVSQGIGWCDWGATDPAFRGRGVQLALLRHRLLVAESLGLARVHTCTGAPAPGDPQHSYRNIQRSGFVETILRRNLKPDAEWGAASDGN
jgi:GNAT superfamily N-acetyltransferase